MRKVLYYRCLLLCLLLTLAGQGQVHAWQTLQITGRVIDAETGEGVPFASLGIPGLQMGTSTHVDGSFALRLQKIRAFDSLQITSLGYAARKLSLYSLSLEEANEISLDPVATVLEELIVSDVPLTAEELVRNAIKAQNKVYNRQPFLMEARYAEVLENSEEVKGYTEAWGYLYVGGHGHVSDGPDIGQTTDLAQWKQIRRSDYAFERKGKDDFRYLRANRLLQVKDFLIRRGPVTRKGWKKYDFEILGQDVYEGRTAWMVGFVEQSSNAEGTLHIMEDDFALVSISYYGRGEVAGEAFSQEEWMRELESFDFHMRFSPLDGTYYLNFIRLDYRFHDEERYHVGACLAGSHYTTASVPVLNRDQRLILYSEMVNPLIFYTEDFWEAAGPFTVPTELGPSFLPESMESEFSFWDRKRLVPLPEGYTSYEEMYRDRLLLDAVLRGF